MAKIKKCVDKNGWKLKKRDTLCKSLTKNRQRFLGILYLIN